jgi:hypothetical protein
MSSYEDILPKLEALLQRFREWQDDPHRRDDVTAMRQIFAEFAIGFGEYGRAVTEMAAWCRLAVGLLDGEDVPLSIHTPLNENPAYTARWRKWRLS